MSTCACDAQGRQVLREHLAPGRYFVAVRSRHKSSGTYRLQVVTRDVTTTSISVNGAQFSEAPAAASVPLTVYVTSASHGGRVQIEIDRLDPLFGWQFASVVNGNVNAGGTSSRTGRRRGSASGGLARGTSGRSSATSATADYVRMHVVEPLE